MSSEEKAKGGLDWTQAMNDALDEAEEGEDAEGINIVNLSGLPSGPADTVPEPKAPEKKTGDAPERLRYVVLLEAAVSQLRSGELSVEEYLKGVKKLDVVADNTLKLYSIPAIKTTLPGKLSEYQNEIVFGLEAQVHKLKEGLGLLLAYPETQAIGELERGLELAVAAMKETHELQKKAATERAKVIQAEKEEKAKRVQKAAESET